MRKLTRLIATENGQYEPAIYEGKNTSGRWPIGDKVLIKTDKASDKLGTTGKLYIPEDTKKTMSLGATTGTICAIGGDAFMWNTSYTKPFSGKRPQPGDRVVFTRYSGEGLLGDDGQVYRMMSEGAIGGLIDIENEGSEKS